MIIDSVFAIICRNTEFKLVCPKIPKNFLSQNFTRKNNIHIIHGMLSKLKEKSNCCLRNRKFKIKIL